MDSQVIPVQLNRTKEAFLIDNKVKTRSIYILVVLVVITAVILSPVIKVSLSVQGRGIIRPVTEKAEVKAFQTEMIMSIQIKEGQYVNKGDTLLNLRQDILQNKKIFLQQELKKNQLYVQDLLGLTEKNEFIPNSNYYIEEYNSYRKKLSEIENKISKASTELDRNKTLFEKEIISKKDYDDLLFNLKQLRREKSTHSSTQIVKWNADLEKYQTNVNDLRKQISELEKQKQFYIITAPVSGTIEEFSGIYVGSILQSGQTITIISPDSDKIAEIYVSAKDIGYLKCGQTTKVQVDAFDYNQWGSIQGEIIDISDDFILVDDTPVFKVKCKVDRDYLELKNGIKGNLKKGMTVNARFMIARRSLFDLLYQKSDDWLNPSRNLKVQ